MRGRPPGSRNAGTAGTELYSLDYVREREALLRPIEERNRAGDGPAADLVNAARAACLRAWLAERRRARNG